MDSGFSSFWLDGIAGLCHSGSGTREEAGGRSTSGALDFSGYFSFRKR